MGVKQSKPSDQLGGGMSKEEKQKYDWDVERYQKKREMLSNLPRNYAVEQCRTSDAAQVFSNRRPNTLDFSNVRVPSAMSKGLTKGEDNTEYYDSETTIQEKAAEVARLLISSRHCVVYTGAGISTTAGMPDFRGPEGAWTKQDQGIYEYSNVQLNEIVPTLAHMAVAKLVEVGLVKFVVTTNMDCLHLKSGVPHDRIVELHGNSFKQRCTVCKHVEHLHEEIYNSPVSRCKQSGCTGLYVDSIVNFAEPIDDDDWRVAKEQSERCDLSIVLGTSMRVLPACLLCEMGPIATGGKMVLCNLQITPYDDNSTPRPFCTTDEFMYYLMKELNIEIPMVTQKGQPIKQTIFPIEKKSYWKQSSEIDQANYDKGFSFLF
ncbi:hypothetical protein PPL_06227 [Heterostelium album PN500]|uniref:protein acetyllysine N-acetyltransferase n=1 Tax=Heterostelium pallidum (strain ATCC 26659 / Pp 5 / PN500) TaxID=670386 RepID=D3BCK2_HETP5|nr:hypothetical protein PPL_06227 [Heterostelium album PN500]EFA80644.1 hypothetical protein PPL_06227 [Heterostelium album PN500]|eukprot:XP_020432764.1 hypothetical protein PPL_06227 [Heterostelium album PN500]